jgi:CubicO group peptidase (beta-lactamase class C family)
MQAAVRLFAAVWLAAMLSLAPGASAEQTRALTPLPPQPAGLEWPTRAWARAPADAPLRKAMAEDERAFFDPANAQRLGVTHALVVIHRGVIVHERYGDGYSCDRAAHTMSIAKMMGAAMAGLLVQDGKIAVADRARLPAWARANDPRQAITIDNILHMTTGLQWKDTGIFDSDLVEMAFGSGFRDLAGYVAAKPLASPPGARFQYSDGTPSLMGEIARREIGGGREAVTGYLRQRLFEPTGMRTAEPEFDMKGVWYGASGMRWSPCDLGRFGYLLMRDGAWDGRRILPAGWTDYMRTPSAAALATPNDIDIVEASYGAYAFVFDYSRTRQQAQIDAFGHLGFGGSILKVVPSRDLMFIVYGARAYSMESMRARLDILKRMEQRFPQTVSAERGKN